MFYNPKRKHTYNGLPSPVDYEIRQQKLNEAGVRSSGAEWNRLALPDQALIRIAH